MKIKVLNDLLTICIFAILLLLVVLVFPQSPARIILGIPFVFFLPGYVLIKAILPKNELTGSFEVVALSVGISLAIVALIGLGLNYTGWGIQIESVLSAIALFVILASNIALIRRFVTEKNVGALAVLDISFPEWRRGRFNKTLNLVLSISIIGALGVLGYTIAAPKIGEKFAEFYILGLDGKAEQYPSSFILDGGIVTQVSYQTGSYVASDGVGSITVGIINHEQREASYFVKILIDGEPINIKSDGKMNAQLGPFSLKDGEKIEQQLGFAPMKLGDKQKVDFLLFEDSAQTPKDSLHLWINVIGPG